MSVIQVRLIAANEQEIEAARLELVEAFGDRFTLNRSRDGKFGDVLAHGELTIPTPPAPRMVAAPQQEKPKRHRRRY